MSKDTTPEDSPLEEPGIGELLRTEREKKGISKSRLAEIIRVRDHFIDALENEEWDKLPARVFIKGFIRSYTISIGYDTKRALRLFDKSVPSRGEESPVPLTVRNKKSRAMYYVVPVLLILAAALYLFTVREKTDNNVEPLKTDSEMSPQPSDVGTGKNLSGQAETVDRQTSEGIKETNFEESKFQETAISEPEKKTVIQEKPQQIQENKPEEIGEESTPAEESPVTVYEEEVPEPETVSAEPPVSMMTLRATVIEKTYVKIIVDDNPPKEFIFQPGSNPDWTAERGFEVTVGNASGIEFEFNGNIYRNLGRSGRVKTLRFPEDFKTNGEE
jgi:cytoskeleton protein RodZ